MSDASHKNMGKKLNKEWGVHARHALYRDTGTWYHRLTSFPGALFDANGYVLFKHESEYLECKQLQLGKQTSCRKGISSIPGYKLGKSIMEQASDLAEPKEADRKLCVIKRIVRDTQRAREVKEKHNNQCQLCHSTLTLFNGETYAEAHHIKPLGSNHHGPDIVENIICVCPNCHAQLDYGAVELSKAILGIGPGHLIKDEFIDYHNTIIYKGAGGIS